MLKILTEAGFEIGFGHFYRMSGVCERAVREGVETAMVLSADEDAQRSLRRPYTAFDRWSERKDFRDLIDPDDLVVVDSYRADLATLEAIRDRAAMMIVIDDNIRLPYRNMRVLNPNFFGSFLHYPEDMGNTYYIGGDYTLLREPFMKPVRRELKERVSDVLITMGGTDLNGMTVRVIDEMNGIRGDDVRLHVVVTGAYRDIPAITDRLRPQDRCHRDIGAEEMRDLMEACDFAVSTAGGTTNELIRMQCPSCVIVVADNQVLNVRYLTEAGVLRRYGTEGASGASAMFDADVRGDMIRRMKAMHSDRGAADLIIGLCKGENNHEK